MSADPFSILARDIMVAEPICVPRSASLAHVVRLFRENDIGGAPVIDRSGSVVGIITTVTVMRRFLERSPRFPIEALLRAVNEPESQSDDPHGRHVNFVEDLMEEAITLPPDATALDVMRAMTLGRQRRVVVVDHNRVPLGMITALRLLKALEQAAAS